jgi:hypothetical protein
VERAVAHSLAQHVHDPALGDLALQPVQELLPLGAVVLQPEPLDGFGLRLAEEIEKLREVQSVVPVVVLRVPLGVTHVCIGRAWLTYPTT